MTHTHHAANAERAASLAENPYAGQGSVLLDIGGDVGRRRWPPDDGRAGNTAVFPELRAGRYVLSLPDRSELVADVDGGFVTEISAQPA